jgi:hypothetical protein
MFLSILVFFVWHIKLKVWVEVFSHKYAPFCSQTEKYFFNHFYGQSDWFVLNLKLPTG